MFWKEGAREFQAGVGRQAQMQEKSREIKIKKGANFQMEDE